MANVDVYLVGGAVRDGLLGLPIKDKDFVVVGATPEHMLDAGFMQVGADFPVFLHPHTKNEYALARTERKSGKGYQGFAVHASPEVTLEKDLQRRDLTINAMAIEVKDLFDDTPMSGEIIDPYGGQADLRNRVLRHVSIAFSEDPLRVLRIARFYGRYANFKAQTAVETQPHEPTDSEFNNGFCVADDTKALIAKMIESGELVHLVAERVWVETARAMMQSYPLAYFECLHDLDALQVLMPSLARLFESTQLVATLRQGLAKMATLELPLHCLWAGLMLGFALQHSTLDHSHADTTQITDNDSLALPRLNESKLNEWLTKVNKLSDSLKLPNKVSKFTELLITLYPYLFSLFNDKANLSAQDLTTLIALSKADKDAINLSNVMAVLEIFGWNFDEQLIDNSINAYQSVTIKDVDASLKGAEIGEALNILRLERIEHLILDT